MKRIGIEEYARHRGVSRKAVQRAIESGRVTAFIEEDGRRLIDADAADREWAIKTDIAKVPHSVLVKKSPGGPENPEVGDFEGIGGGHGDGDDENGDDAGFYVSKAKNEFYKAAFAKLEYEEKLGSLVAKEEVQANLFNCARRVRDAILNIPNRISNELASETDPVKVHASLTKSLTEALEELVSDREHVATDNEAV